MYIFEFCVGVGGSRSETAPLPKNRGAPPPRLKNHPKLGKNSRFCVFFNMGHRRYWGGGGQFLPLGLQHIRKPIVARKHKPFWKYLQGRGSTYLTVWLCFRAFRARPGKSWDWGGAFHPKNPQCLTLIADEECCVDFGYCHQKLSSLTVIRPRRHIWGY